MSIKQESLSDPQILSLEIWRIADSPLKKGKSAIPPLFNGTDSDEAKWFSEIFPENFNFDKLGILKHAFPSRANRKLLIIHATFNMVKQIITYHTSVSWVYSSGGSKELRARTFINIS